MKTEKEDREKEKRREGEREKITHNMWTLKLLSHRI